MDPNTLTNLDPKLRETYERVMGTTTPAPAEPPAASDQPSAQIPVPTPAADPLPITASEPAPEQASPSPTPSTPTLSAPAADTLSAPLTQPLSTNDQPQNVTINQPLPDPSVSAFVAKPHGHMGLIRVFYILGGIVFFVIYIFFWMKIFNIQLPFLP